MTIPTDKSTVNPMISINSETGFNPAQAAYKYIGDIDLPLKPICMNQEIIESSQSDKSMCNERYNIEDPTMKLRDRKSVV